ncbi:hypothetical protein FRC07_004198 [Ceratobasidium sp. 392]|nr:hypothetical protein FRC07_004198 [Ceratobasidium sp. 392]
MLCENCQYGIGSGVNGDNGFDGAPGTYQIFLGGCGAGTNQSLPNTVQTAVCNQGIGIPNYLYTLFWGDGAWFYEYTRGDAALQIQSGQNVTKFCNSTNTSKTSSITTPTSSSTRSPSASSKPQDDSSGPNIGAIVGGAVGGVGLLVIAVLVFWFSRRRRSRRGSVDLAEEKQPDMTFEPYIHHPTPAAPPSANPSSNGPSSSTGYTHTNTSSDFVSTSAYTSQPRSTKAGMVAHSPPTRDEIRPSMPGPVSSTHSSDRHEDSTELSQAFGIGRSASGRLPPSYQER